MSKKTIVISAVNFTSGGPLSVLTDVLNFLNDNLTQDFRVVALVHKSEMFCDDFPSIEFKEFPSSVKSYIVRMYLEYFKFKKISDELKPYLWFSLHDMTPNTNSTVRAVYCHNPSPFYKPNLRELTLDKAFYMFTLFYKWFYRININKNKYVVVQQQWLRDSFINMYNLDPNKIVVAYPEIKNLKFDSDKLISNIKKDKYRFFYPSFPRVFKNIETILDAVQLLNLRADLPEFEVVLTIDGTENKYSSFLLKKYSKISNVKFLGLLSRDDVYKNLVNSDCLVFASKLETWGLPLSEAKLFNIPILAADLPYAHETVGSYDNISFFNPHSASQLAELMEKAILEHSFGAVSDYPIPGKPFARNWSALFDILLN